MSAVPQIPGYLDTARRRGRSRRTDPPGGTRRHPTPPGPSAKAEPSSRGAYRPTSSVATRPYRRTQSAPTTDGGGRWSAAASRSTASAAGFPARPLPVQPVGAPEPLKTGLERIRRDQERARATAANGAATAKPARRRVRRRLAAILALPVTLLVAALIVVVPILYQGTRAYQHVFVPKVPHNQAPVLPVINPSGTPVLAGAAAAPAQVPDWNGTDKLTILLLGIDRRTNETSRSDTMILVSIDPVAKKAAMLSIPRDLKVVVPGYGIQKINAAFAFGDANADKVPGGGPGLAIRTIEANFGLPINYFAEVDFQGFTKIVDTVGGLTLDVPYPIKDDEYPASGENYTRVYFPAGWQHMDGARALEYARTRHDDGDGRRSARQQQVLLALRERAVRLDLLPKVSSLIGDFADSVRTDLKPTQAIQLVRLGSQLTAASITQYSLDAAVTEDATPGQPYYLDPDWDAVGTILSRFTGTTINPPAAALSHPNYAIPISVTNGSGNPGLAHRVVAVLTENGFTDVTIAEGADAVSQTTIVDATGSIATAAFVAGIVGVSTDVIDERYGGPAASTVSPTPAAPPSPAGGSPGSSPAASPTTSASPPSGPTATVGPGAATAGIVVSLGADAPDPANATDPNASDGGGGSAGQTPAPDGP